MDWILALINSWGVDMKLKIKQTRIPANKLLFTVSELFVSNRNIWYHITLLVQSVGAVEYTDCTSAAE